MIGKAGEEAMPIVKKCPTCGSVWYSALPKCAFCGVEGVEQEMAVLTGKVHGERSTEAAPKPEPKEPEVAVAEATPVPPTSADAPAPAAEVKPETAQKKTEPIALVRDVPQGKTEPVPVVRDEPAAPRPPLTPAPQLPSAAVPLVFGWIGVGAFLLLLACLYAEENRVIGSVGYIAYAVLAPFAPFAWLLGQRYVDACDEMGFEPAGQARLGRILGIIGTFVLIFQAAVAALLVAVLRIAQKLPPTFGG
jgi:hypothetical protein